MRPFTNERGTATIEMTAVLLLTVTLLATIAVIGRLTSYLLAAEKSVANATRIMAAMPRETLTAPEAGTDVPLRIRTLVRDSLASAGVDALPRADTIVVLCGTGACGPAVLACDAQVVVDLMYFDNVFGSVFTSDLVSIDGLPIHAASTQRCAPAPAP